ncbi:MAG TPA: GNAT family N-acetyltransferase [Actinomycetota bacterium]|nr:GNAT family N-acetyltransferase [Actinomycetota bacterium]
MGVGGRPGRRVPDRRPATSPPRKPRRGCCCGRSSRGPTIGRRSGDRGWIAELGVRPAWRDRGIGVALLRASFARFARLGLREALLSVDSENATGATCLYERVGMRSRFRFDFYEKAIE